MNTFLKLLLISTIVTTSSLTAGTPSEEALEAILTKVISKDKADGKLSAKDIKSISTLVKEISEKAPKWTTLDQQKLNANQPLIDGFDRIKKHYNFYSNYSDITTLLKFVNSPSLTPLEKRALSDLLPHIIRTRLDNQSHKAPDKPPTTQVGKSLHKILREITASTINEGVLTEQQYNNGLNSLVREAEYFSPFTKQEPINWEDTKTSYIKMLRANSKSSILGKINSPQLTEIEKKALAIYLPIFKKSLYKDPEDIKANRSLYSPLGKSMRSIMKEAVSLNHTRYNTSPERSLKMVNSAVMDILRSSPAWTNLDQKNYKLNKPLITNFDAVKKGFEKFKDEEDMELLFKRLNNPKITNIEKRAFRDLLAYFLRKEANYKKANPTMK